MENDLIKVSVVVPIYGVEKYLHQCVDSILAQTLKNIEIILVDDGSPDKCPQIVDEYAKKDSRIITVHQQNGGYGCAVNHGIELAKGEYIGIVEPDDWIEPNMYEKLYHQAKKFNADVCKGGFYKYDSYKKVPDKKWIFEYQNIESFPDNKTFTVKEFPLITGMHASIWSSIYNKSFLANNNIKLNQTKEASYQDFPFMVEVMCCAKRIITVHEYFYHWRVEENQNSSTTSCKPKVMIMADQCEKCKELAKKFSLYDVVKEALYIHFYHSNMGFYDMIDEKYKKTYFKKLHHLFSPLKTDKTFQYKHFSQEQKKRIKKVINNQFLLFTYNNKILRRFLFSLHISNQGFCLQILGIQISTKKYKKRPALIKINI